MVAYFLILLSDFTTSQTDFEFGVPCRRERLQYGPYSEACPELCE
jgi:hypothetical protein